MRIFLSLALACLLCILLILKTNQDICEFVTRYISSFYIELVGTVTSVIPLSLYELIIIALIFLILLFIVRLADKLRLRQFRAALSFVALATALILAVADSAVWLLLAFLGTFFIWLAWIFARLYLSYLCDIKLIRNKLYGADNDRLAAFIENQEEEQANSASESGDMTYSVAADKLLQLKRLLDSGAITQEEFDEQKKKLLG